MSLVSFRNCCKSYPDAIALDNVSLDIVDGVTTAVVGRSGSGKSTLLQMINGLIRPTHGTVAVFGNKLDYNNLTNLRRAIGYAVQGVGLFPHLNVERNISLLAQLEGWDSTRITQRLDELLSLAEIPRGFRSRYPHELSGGQQQRVGLCRALMLDPDVLLLDEAFGALDAITKTDVYTEFLNMQSLRPRTTVLVTHDAREAARLAQRVIVLEKGAVLQHDKFGDVMSNPASDTVTRLIHRQLES